MSSKWQKLNQRSVKKLKSQSSEVQEIIQMRMQYELDLKLYKRELWAWEKVKAAAAQFKIYDKVMWTADNSSSDKSEVFKKELCKLIYLCWDYNYNAQF